MKFEHFALNVPDARRMSLWYVDHLGMQIVRRREEAPYTHFLADETGRVIMELYTNPESAIPDYPSAHPLTFHVAVVAENALAAQERLEMAGARLFKEDTLPDGTILTMMRDPWGVPLQLCQRANPF